jgi:hypothetical protein
MTGIVVVQPLEITDAMLVATDVPENDYGAWSSVGVYAAASRAISTVTHKIYQAVQELINPAVTFSNALRYPAGIVVAWVAHRLAAGATVVFSNSGGALPTGIAPATAYYVRNPGTDDFQLSATPDGALVAYVDAGTGTHFASTVAMRDPTVAANRPEFWLEASPTNRWKLFDLANSTRTAKANSFYYEFALGVPIDTAYLGSIVGATAARALLTDPVYGVVYDETVDLTPLPLASDWFDWSFGQREIKVQALFRELPPFPNAVLRVEATGGADLAIGSLVVGTGAEFGRGIAYGARAARATYSRREKNQFGDLDLVHRPSARTLQCVARIANTEIDALDAFLDPLDAKPILFIGYDGYAATTVLGIYQSYETLIPHAKDSDVSFDFLGFT